MGEIMGYVSIVLSKEQFLLLKEVLEVAQPEFEQTPEESEFLELFNLIKES